MKKILLLAIGISFATVSFAQKFAYCNSAALLSEIPEVKAADSDLQAFQTQLVKRGQEMIKNLQDKAAELDRKQKQGQISPKDLETQTAKLKEEEEKIIKYEQEVYEKLSQKREALYKPILDRVNDAMAEVAKENAYTFVFDLNSQIILFAEDSLDATPLVKAKLSNK